MSSHHESCRTHKGVGGHQHRPRENDRLKGLGKSAKVNQGGLLWGGAGGRGGGGAVRERDQLRKQWGGMREYFGRSKHYEKRHKVGKSKIMNAETDVNHPRAFFGELSLSKFLSPTRKSPFSHFWSQITWLAISSISGSRTGFFQKHLLSKARESLLTRGL